MRVTEPDKKLWLATFYNIDGKRVGEKVYIASSYGNARLAVCSDTLSHPYGSVHFTLEEYEGSVECV